MEIMEFVFGLYAGLIAGFLLRGLFDKLELTYRRTHGSETKKH